MIDEKYTFEWVNSEEQNKQPANQTLRKVTFDLLVV